MAIELVGRSARRSRPASASRSARRQAAIDNWILLEYRGVWGPEPLQGSMLDPSVKAHLRRAALALRARSCSSSAGRARSGTASSATRRRPPKASRRLHRLELDVHEELRRPRPLRRRPRAEGGRAAVRRLHARQARPLLRAVRPPAVRRAARPVRSRMGLAVHARRRRPLRRQPRLLSRRGCTSGGSGSATSLRCSTITSPGAIYLDCYRGRAAYSMRVQAAERAVRERTGLTGFDDVQLVA